MTINKTQQFVFILYRTCHCPREIETSHNKNDNEEGAKKSAHVFYESADLRTRKTLSLPEISLAARQGRALGNAESLERASDYLVPKSTRET